VEVVVRSSSEVDGLPLLAVRHLPPADSHLARAEHHPAVITVLAPVILTHDPVDAKPHPAVVAAVNTRLDPDLLAVAPLPGVPEVIVPLARTRALVEAAAPILVAVLHLPLEGVLTVHLLPPGGDTKSNYWLPTLATAGLQMPSLTTSIDGC